jgi:hypothetical protein
MTDKAWSVLMPVKVLDSAWDTIFGAPNVGTDDSVARGIRYAVDNGARIINMSLGRTGAAGSAPVVEDAIKYAVGKGAFVAIAGGNEFEDGNPTEVIAEIANRIQGAVSVAALDRNHNRAFYSSTGNYIELAAPGGSFRGFDSDGGILQQTLDLDLVETYTMSPARFTAPRFDAVAYFYFTGTSMATPHVSGLAAMLMQQGFTSPAAIEAALEKFATDRGAAGRDDETGFGEISARAALRVRAGEMTLARTLLLSLCSQHQPRRGPRLRTPLHRPIGNCALTRASRPTSRAGPSAGHRAGILCAKPSMGSSGMPWAVLGRRADRAAQRHLAGQRLAIPEGEGRPSAQWRSHALGLPLTATSPRRGHRRYAELQSIRASSVSRGGRWRMRLSGRHPIRLRTKCPRHAGMLAVGGVEYRVQRWIGSPWTFSTHIPGVLGSGGIGAGEERSGWNGRALPDSGRPLRQFGHVGLMG